MGPNWTALVGTGVVGTDRTGADPAAFLSAVVVSRIRTLAGRRAVRGVIPPEPTEADARPPASEAASTVLRSLWRLDYTARHELVGEWVKACVRSERVAAAETLPALMFAEVTPDDYRAVLGERGRWFATHADYPEAVLHRWRLGMIDPGEWTTADPETRAALLRAWRHYQPSAARRRLMRDVETGRGGWRLKKLVGTLEEHATLDDEDDLERLLDHPYTGVRRGAANALLRLPESDFAARNAARLGDSLREVRDDEIMFGPPPPLTERMRRDRLDDADEAHGLDADMVVLTNIVEGTPLAWWEARTGLGPDEVIPRLYPDAAADPLREAVIEGMRRAIVRQRNPVWAAAWLGHRLRAGTFEGQSLVAEQTMSRWLDEATVKALLRPLLGRLSAQQVRPGKTEALHRDLRHLVVLSRYIGWKPEATARVFGVVAALMRAGYFGEAAHPLLRDLVYPAYPATALTYTADLYRLVGRGSHTLRYELDKMVRRLEYRADIAAAFAT
jgi:hypothetical protein